MRATFTGPWHILEDEKCNVKNIRDDKISKNSKFYMTNYDKKFQEKISKKMKEK